METKRKEKHLNVTVCRPRKSRSHPKERIKFIKKGFGAFNTPTTQPYIKKRRRRKKSVVIIITFYSSILLIILQLRKDVPLTTKKKKKQKKNKPTNNQCSVILPRKSLRDATLPPCSTQHTTIPQREKGKKKFQSKKRKKKNLLLLQSLSWRVIIFNLARRAEELRDTPTELTWRPPSFAQKSLSIHEKAKKVTKKNGRTHTQNQPVDPPIRGLFSARGAHDQFPRNQWGYFFFWLRRRLCHLTPDSVNQTNRLSTVKGRKKKRPHPG